MFPKSPEKSLFENVISFALANMLQLLRACIDYVSFLKYLGTIFDSDC